MEHKIKDFDLSEITGEIKESTASYNVDGETYVWKNLNLLESGCYSCEIPRDDKGKCKCPIHPCSNMSGFYVRIKSVQDRLLQG